MQNTCTLSCVHAHTHTHVHMHLKQAHFKDLWFITEIKFQKKSLLHINFVKIDLYQ